MIDKFGNDRTVVHRLIMPGGLNGRQLADLGAETAPGAEGALHVRLYRERHRPSWPARFRRAAAAEALPQLRPRAHDPHRAGIVNSSGRGVPRCPADQDGMAAGRMYSLSKTVSGKSHSVRQPGMDKRDHAQIRNDHQTLTAPPHRTGPFHDLSVAERAPEPPVITVEEQSRSVVARLDGIRDPSRRDDLPVIPNTAI